MTRIKYEGDYGLIIRNYQVRCPNPKCKKWIFVTYDDFTCQHCGTDVCPDCLKELHTTRHDYPGSDGGFEITCNSCGYAVIDC